MEKQPADTKSGTILIKQAKIQCPGSEHNNRQVDILITDGFISEIGVVDKQAEFVFDGHGLTASPGFFDLRSRHGEPGLEQNEDVESLISVASHGGFTGMLTLPDTEPCIQSRAQIEFLNNKAKNKLVSLYPLGATTLGLEGLELSELYDMHKGGAIGFSNADHAYNTGALQRALLYSKPFGGLIFSHSEDKHLRNGGFINESKNTASLGIKSFASHAEYTALSHEIEIVRYTDSKLHFSHITTFQSVELIRKAKAEGLDVTCDASILHLIYTDKAMHQFDANLKLMPPLRTEEDKVALIEGVLDGTIDCIVSDHNPQCSENKVVEFNYSPFGAITAQQFYSLYVQHLSEQIPMDTFLNACAINPRRILNLPIPQFAIGESANFVLLNPTLKWELNNKTNQSLSSNTHLWGETLQGQCVFIFHNGQFLSRI